MGITFEPSVIVPIEDLDSSAVACNIPKEASPLNLVSILSAGGSRLGLMVPHIVARSNPSAVPRPLAEDGLQVFGRRHWLSTSGPLDIDMLRQKFGGSSGLAPVRAGSSDQLVQVKSESSHPTTKLAGKCQVLVQAASKLMECFQQPAWQQMREGSFSKIVKDLASLNGEASGEGDVQIMQTTGKWLSAAITAKKYIKLYRDYDRSKNKDLKLRELAESLLATADFVNTELQVPLEPAFLNLSLKACFYKESDSKGLYDALNAVIARGLVPTLECMNATESQDARPRQCPQIWLQGLIMHGIADMINDEGQHINTISKVVGEVGELMKSTTGMAKLVPNVLEVLSQFELIVEVGKEGSKATGTVKLNEAVKAFGSQELALFAKQVSASSRWKLCMDQAAALLQLSGKDTLGDQRLARAKEILTDDRLPSLRMGDHDSAKGVSTATVANFNLISDLSVLGSFQESMDLISEAAHLWSNLRGEQQGSAIGEWVGELLHSLAFVDECLCMLLHALCKKAGLFEMMKVSNVGGDLWPSSADLRRVADALSDHSVDEHSLEEFLLALHDLIKGLPANILKSVDVNEMKEIVVDRLLANHRQRLRLKEALQCLIDIGDLPASPAKALDEWHAKKSVGKGGEAGINKALVFSKGIQALKGSDFLLGDVGVTEEVSLSLDEGTEGCTTFTASVHGVRTFVTDLTNAPLVAAIGSFFKESLQVVVANFVVSLHFPVIGSPESLEAAGVKLNVGGLGAILQPFFVHSDAGDLVKVVAKIFTVKSTKTWECDMVFGLVFDLLAVMPVKLSSLSPAAFGNTLAPAARQLESNEDFRRYFKILLCMAKVSGIFAYLSTRFVHEKEMMVREHKLKYEIENALNVVRTCLNEGAQLCGQLPEGISELELPVGGGPIHLVRWFESAKVAHGLLLPIIYQVCLEAFENVATDVNTATPKYEHIVGDTVLNRAQAKKHILCSEGGKKLSDKVVVLFHALAHVSRLRSQWSIPAATASEGDADGARTTWRWPRTSSMIPSMW